MRRITVLLAGAVIAVSALAAPVGALETTSYGLDVVETTEDGRLRIAIAAGRTTSGRLRVWNKEQRPLTLRFSVVPATVDPSGAASLGGDDEPVGWVEVPDEVRLAPGGRTEVLVRVDAPRRLDGETRTVAVVAEPALVGDEPPAVVQRLAVTTYLVPEAGSLVAELGPIVWVALGVLVSVTVALVVVRRRRRSAAGEDGGTAAGPPAA